MKENIPFKASYQVHDLFSQVSFQAGDAQFVKDALQFAYGQSDPRIQGVQALSGTGGLRVFGELLARDHADIYVPNPTWGNHKAIFTNAGLKVHQYRYYDANESALDFEGMIEDLKSVPSGSWVLLHACAHNPTGMDPSLEEWKQVSDLCLERNLHPFFDCAYQGFASGDAEKDAAALRMFVEDGHELACIQSFSKNFGLYGHRVGALSVVAQDAEATTRTISQLKTVIRPMYSNPPIHGARIVSTILQDDALSQQWSNECRDMAHRIHGMRTALKDALRQAGSTRNWDHVTKQIGMFAFSGLNKDQVMEMRSKHHIYCTADGRISMAGVTTGNVEYIAQAIHDVTK